MAAWQRSSKRNGCTAAASHQQQHQPNSDGLLDMDCVLQHPLLAQSLANISRLLCTSKATAAAVHQHAAGHLQQLHLSLKDLEHTEQVAAWLIKHSYITHGVRSMFLQPPQLLSPLGLEEAVEAEEVLAAAVMQVPLPRLVSLQLSRFRSLAVLDMLPHLPTSLQRLQLELNPSAFYTNIPSFELTHLTCLAELVLQGSGGRMRYNCQVPASLQRLTIPGGSHVGLLSLVELRSLDITACEWQGHRELAAIGAALTKLTHFGLVPTPLGDSAAWLGRDPYSTVAALQRLPLQSLRAIHAATPLRGCLDVFASQQLLGRLTGLTRLEMSDQWRGWDEVDRGGRFEARSLAAGLQRLSCLQELRLEGSLEGGDNQDAQEGTTELMRVLGSLPQLRQLHLNLDDVGPAVVQLKDAQQLTQLYCKSRSATEEQMQQLVAPGRVFKFVCAGVASSDDDD